MFNIMVTEIDSRDNSLILLKQGAMFHDCLSVDPQVQSSILPLFLEPHECYCLALFMCPPLSSLELCFMIN